MWENPSGQAERAHGRSRVAAADHAEPGGPVPVALVVSMMAWRRRRASTNGASSNTPIGPFQNTVFALAITCANAA